MTIEEWAKDFKSYVNALDMPRDDYNGIIEYIDDAIDLLKEQEAKAQGADSGMCEICSFYERAMPVKPHYNARTNWYECGACHYSMIFGMNYRSGLIPAYGVGFCAKCGKAVDWE